VSAISWIFAFQCELVGKRDKFVRDYSYLTFIKYATVMLWQLISVIQFCSLL